MDGDCDAVFACVLLCVRIITCDPTSCDSFVLAGEVTIASTALCDHVSLRQ
jgi:hypothetical protein